MVSFETKLVKKEMKEHPKSRSPLIRNIKNIFKRGWRSESARHSLAHKGIKTSRKIPNVAKQIKEHICLGCGGTGYVIKMPEKKKKICRLCGGSGLA